MKPLVKSTCKRLSDTFPIQNGLKRGNALSPLFFNFALKYAMRKKMMRDWNWMEHISSWSLLVC